MSAHLLERRARPADDGRAADTESARRDDARNDGLEPLVPVIALYAQHVGADLVTIGIIVGLFSAVHAPANLLFGRIADRLGGDSRFNRPSLGCHLAVPVFAGDDAAPPRARPGESWHRERTRRSEFDGTYRRHLRAGAERPGDGPLRDVSRPGRGDRLRDRGSDRRSIRVLVLFYVVSTGLLAGFVITIPISEPPQTASTAMPWRRLVSYAGRPSPAAGYAAIFSLYFILGAFVALVPLHLQQELGYGALAVGLSFTAFAILSLLLHYPAGILADRYGPATPATIGLVAVAIAIACIPLIRDSRRSSS